MCFFAGVLFTGIRNYKTEKKENPVQGVSSESSLKGYLGKGYAYAGAQDNISAGEESFGEQAQLLEDTKDEEAEPQEQKQAEVTATPEATPTPEPESQNEDEQKAGQEQKSADDSDGEWNDDSKENTINMIMQENRTIAVRRQLRIRMMTGIRREHSSR